jgi:hypothetical protein
MPTRATMSAGSTGGGRNSPKPSVFSCVSGGAANRILTPGFFTLVVRARRRSAGHRGRLPVYQHLDLLSVFQPASIADSAEGGHSPIDEVRFVVDDHDPCRHRCHPFQEGFVIWALTGV